MTPQPLANEFYWLAHDDASGRPRLRPTIAGVGLAGALLGELLIGGTLAFWNGTVIVRSHDPPEDVLARHLQAEIVADPGHGVDVWLSAVSHEALPWITMRLRDAGLIRRAAPGRKRGRSVNVPTDPWVATLSWARLSTQLSRGDHLSVADACLVGLARATGLDRWLLEGLPDRAASYAEDIVADLSDPLRQLVAVTEAAVGNAVLTYKT